MDGLLPRCAIVEMFNKYYYCKFSINKKLFLLQVSLRSIKHKAQLNDE